VTVLMPAYNAEAHVEEAVDSVLAQSFGDLELLVVDDGSTDGTAERVKAVNDPRLRVLRRDRAGVVGALNAGLDAARGELLARLDADDVMVGDRLARQVAFLDRRPDIVACGTDYEMFGTVQGRVRMPRTPAACRARLLFGTCVAHGTVMLRLGTLRREGLSYRPEYAYAEDFKLFSELRRRGSLANLPFVGLRYRQHPGQVSTANAAAQRAVATTVIRENLAEAGVRDVSDAVVERMIWLDRRGLPAALSYLTHDAPRLLAAAARAGGRHGLVSATQLARERVNTALRTTGPSHVR